MNNGVVDHDLSRAPSIYLDVSPLGSDATAKPNSEYVVKFVVPEDAKSQATDAQYVLELVGDSPESEPPAKFTTAPPGGGIGCDGRRSHGKATQDSAAILTINENAPNGGKLEIVAGWATGHEAVTLTERVVLVVGKGIAAAKKVETATTDENFDDALDDDEAEAELEEAFIEEEREEVERDIEEAEEDAVEALEEKRQETDGSWEGINDVEDEIVEELEENRKDVDQALNSLKEEIMIRQVEKQKERVTKHLHNQKERQQAMHEHRAAHERKRVEDRLEEMHHRFEKQHDLRKDRLDELMDKKAGLNDNIKKLKIMDKKEHETARRKHIKQLPKEELKVDMDELKQRAKKKMKYISDKLGVNELLNEPHMKELRKGLIRGGEGKFHGDVGDPLPPQGRHFLIVIFTFFILVGLVRWFFEKRRKKQKGRRTL